MAKPILLIKVPISMTRERQEAIGKNVEGHLKNEYHVLMAGIKDDDTEAEFQVFNVESMPESTLEEIKKIVSEANAG